MFVVIHHHSVVWCAECSTAGSEYSGCSYWCSPSASEFICVCERLETGGTPHFIPSTVHLLLLCVCECTRCSDHYVGGTAQWLGVQRHHLTARKAVLWACIISGWMSYAGDSLSSYWLDWSSVVTLLVLVLWLSVLTVWIVYVGKCSVLMLFLADFIMLHSTPRTSYLLNALMM